MADKEEVWMNWGGGAQPVSGSTCVDIKQADGQQFSGSANAFYWAHDGDPADVMAWRVSDGALFKPDQCPYCQSIIHPPHPDNGNGR